MYEKGCASDRHPATYCLRTGANGRATRGGQKPAGIKKARCGHALVKNAQWRLLKRHHVNNTRAIPLMKTGRCDSKHGANRQVNEPLTTPLISLIPTDHTSRIQSPPPHTPQKPRITLSFPRPSPHPTPPPSPSQSIALQVSIYLAIPQVLEPPLPGQQQVLDQEGGRHHAHAVVAPPHAPQLSHGRVHKGVAWGGGGAGWRGVHGWADG